MSSDLRSDGYIVITGSGLGSRSRSLLSLLFLADFCYTCWILSVFRLICLDATVVKVSMHSKLEIICDLFLLLLWHSRLDKCALSTALIKVLSETVELSLLSLD